MHENSPENRVLSDEELETLVSLRNALLKIHNRLMHEGYKVVDGEIFPPEPDAVYNGDINKIKNEHT